MAKKETIDNELYIYDEEQGLRYVYDDLDGNGKADGDVKRIEWYMIDEQGTYGEAGELVVYKVQIDGEIKIYDIAIIF